MIQEKRFTRRVSLSFPVVCLWAGADPAQAQTADVSPGGVFVRTDHPQGTGTDVELVFSGGPFASPMKVPARVRRTAAWGMGLSFEKHSWSVEDRQHFFSLISALLRGGAARRTPSGGGTPVGMTVAKVCACGWSGYTGRYAHSCPRCGQTLSEARG